MSLWILVVSFDLPDSLFEMHSSEHFLISISFSFPSLSFIHYHHQHNHWKNSFVLWIPPRVKHPCVNGRNGVEVFSFFPLSSLSLRLALTKEGKDDNNMTGGEDWGTWQRKPRKITSFTQITQDKRDKKEWLIEKEVKESLPNIWLITRWIWKWRHSWIIIQGNDGRGGRHLSFLPFGIWFSRWVYLSLSYFL